MKRPGPIAQITLALTLLGCTVLVMAQLMWKVFPDPVEHEATWRQAHAESAAAQTLFMLERGLHVELQRTLDLAAKADSRILSVGVRRADGVLLAQTRGHGEHWIPLTGEAASFTHVLVPIRSGDTRWGQLEMAFVPQQHGWLSTLARYPLAVAVVHFMLIAGVLYWLYLRRAMVLLDPKAVIPERIRAAYDVMTEGVALLDARGRVLMVNRAFEQLPGDKWPDVTGKKLSALPWLATGLPADTTQHPWAETLRSGRPCHGHEVRTGSGGTRRLLINCAAIPDAEGKPRGCLVTFSDVSALQRANEQLSAALAQLQTSQHEIERQNLALERLASRDTLSGCLTRGAGMQQGQAAVDAARRDSSALSCLMLDIDRFKSINDSFGHAVGDDVIRALASALQSVLEPGDLATRQGGDEFFVLLPGRNAQASRQVAERLRSSVQQSGAQLSAGGRALTVTVSIGVAEWNAPGMADLDALLAAADEALYEAKAHGRNCVRVNAAAALALSGD